MKKITFVLSALLLLFFTGCNTVKETGRTSLILMSVEEEQQMGIETYEEILSESTISANAEYNERLDRIAKKIIEAVGDAAPSGTAWEWHVLQDNTVNAFAVPGGKIAVYSGLMAIASDDELAYVVGHEIAHVTARHGAERMSQQALLNAVENKLTGSMTSEKNKALFETAYGLGINVGILLPYSRQNEYEADEIGSLYAAKAGFNPMGGISMLNKLKVLSQGAESPEWLSTHPLDDNRIAALEKLLPERMKIYSSTK